MRQFRAGWLYPVSNVVASSVLTVGMVLVGVISIGARLQSHDGTDRMWTVIATAFTLLGLLVGLAVLCSGINGFRPVLLDATHLRLPTFSIRRGFGRLDIPLDDVAGVEMSYRSVARSSRWQLMVIRLQHANAYCDSLTSTRSQKRGVTGTTAARVADELRRALPTDRLARWNLP